MRLSIKVIAFAAVVCVLAQTLTAQQLATTDRAPDRDSGQVVRLWNQIATDAIVATGANAPASSGVLLAIVQLAVYDAVVSIHGGFKPWASVIPAPRGASIGAAVAQSAHDVLVDLLPLQADALHAQLAAALAAIPDDQHRTDGIWVGRQAAASVLASRANDGRFANHPYTFGQPGPGIYQPTPPAFSTSPLVPWVAELRPFTMTSPSQFRPGPPPSLHSRAWAKAYNLAKKYGDINSTARTPEQSDVAIFWTENTASQWNRNIRAHAARVDLSGIDTARLLAVTNTAMADAWIGCWDAKYHYSFWRPVTAIRQGDTDDRSDTTADPAWTPFRTTPNHPEYPGAHACVSTAAGYALKRFFRADKAFFPMDGVVAGVTYHQTFTRYTDAGASARDARIYGGMHYSFSNEAGERIGRQVVRWMFAKGYFRRMCD
jgi:hypothetical protein